MSEERITARQRAILTAVVERYIETGEPVGSSAIAGAVGSTHLSSATVRNEMMALAETGLLEQPHTSAGRVPTAQAFRIYVEQLHGGAAAKLAGPSRAEVESRIETSFAELAGAGGASALLERTSHVLASLSSGVGVAIGAQRTADVLEHVHFSSLAERRVLAVVVTRAGVVRDRLLSLDHELSRVELETAGRFLNEHFRGWSLDDVRVELARRLESERNNYKRLMEAAQQLWSQVVPEGAPAAAQTVFVEGVSNLIALPEDRSRLREMLVALEAKQRVVELLNAYIDARQSSVRVVFDLEEQAPEMAGLVLIAAPARVGGDALGAVGVLGSKRMHYENTMNAVAYVAQVLDRMLVARHA